MAAFASEWVAVFTSEWVAGFVGIRTLQFRPNDEAAKTCMAEAKKAGA